MKVLTIGTFDLLHYGHLRLLKRCYELGDLVIGINDDLFVQQYKGKPPVMTYRQRELALHDMGFTNTEKNRSKGVELIRQIRPDLLVIGSDWADKNYLDQIGMTWDELDRLGIALVFLPRTPIISSTAIKESVS